MLQYVSDSLIASAVRRGRIPDNAFTVAELLSIANEEMESYLVPLIVSAQESYYETFVDVPVSTDYSTIYRIPSRAVGGALKEIVFLDVSGREVDVPRIDVTDLEQASWGFVLQGQGVRYVNRIGRADTLTLRMHFPFSPSPFCQAANAALITAINGSAITLGAVPPAPVPLLSPADGGAPGNMASVTLFDIVKGTPGFEVAGFDLAGTVSGSVLTLSSPVPTGIAVGDYVCQARQTPLPAAPTCMHPLLAQSIAVACLERLGQGDDAQAEAAKRADMQKRVLPLIENRVRGAPKSITPRRNIFAAAKRW